MRRLAIVITLGLALALAALGCAGVCGEDLLQCRGRCEAYKECKDRGCQSSRELAYIRECRSLGVAWSEPGRGGDETLLELYYRIGLVPHLSLTPDLQLLCEPVGRGCEVVGGLRLALRL